MSGARVLGLIVFKELEETRLGVVLDVALVAAALSALRAVCVGAGGLAFAGTRSSFCASARRRRMRFSRCFSAAAKSLGSTARTGVLGGAFVWAEVRSFAGNGKVWEPIVAG